jgi:hypothetical protein
MVNNKINQLTLMRQAMRAELMLDVDDASHPIVQYRKKHSPLERFTVFQNMRGFLDDFISYDVIVPR